MAFDYISTEEAIAAPGVRMTVVSNVPSPWGEAAKGLLYIKGIEWHAVRLDTQDEAQCTWSGHDSAPALVYNDEAPISRWDEILAFCERVSPSPPLLPADERLRALALELSEDICGGDGLGWHRRLQAIHRGLTGEAGGFPPPAAKYLAGKYGYTPDHGIAAGDKVRALLEKLAAQLQAQSTRGSAYYVGDALSCADIYSATFCTLFSPLPEDQCAMSPALREAFGASEPAEIAALLAPLLAHRDRIYADHLELPLSL